MIVTYLNKYSRSFDFKKAGLYQDYKQQADLIKAQGYDFKVKSSFDLYKYQVISRALNNEIEILGQMKAIMVEHDDLIKYLNYQERRNLYQVEMNRIVANLPHLQYDTPIYLPGFNETINSHLLQDYETLSLKKYQDILKGTKRDYQAMFNQYGFDLLSGPFCDLELVDRDENTMVYYGAQMEVLYLVDVTQLNVVELVLKDKWYQGEFNHNQVVDLAHLLVSEPEGVYPYLIDQKLVSDKFVKKMEKKLK